MELRYRALQVLCLTDPEHKAAAAIDMYARAASFSIATDTAPSAPADPAALPGRPERPELRHHTAMARRSPATAHGRAVLLHAIAHIEFNAIKKVRNAN